MQFWPHNRVKREYPRVRSWPVSKTAKLLAVAGYKVGMTHIMVHDKRPNSSSKGEQVSFPVTIIECPPMTIWGVRFYKSTIDGKKAVTQLTMESPKKEFVKRLLNRQIRLQLES